MASTILENVRKYQNSRMSLNLNKGNSGGKRAIQTAGNIDAARDLLLKNAQVSAPLSPIPISHTTSTGHKAWCKMAPIPNACTTHMAHGCYLQCQNIIKLRGVKDFQQCTSKLWNSLPLKIKSIASVKPFTWSIVNIFLEYQKEHKHFTTFTILFPNYCIIEVLFMYILFDI